MIRLHLLGAPRLEGVGAGAPRSVFAQPRRAALLAYLALRAPHGPQRRDALLAVFWPESDADHARGALRNALHFLRASLGPGIVLSRGSEAVDLDPDRFWCDAVEFERLCDAGDLAAALRLYGGDLMEGFFISEAPEFERWLEDERGRLLQRAAQAARSLAEQAEAAGERGMAVHRWRQLMQLMPTDEAAARNLMRLLAESDDRGAALRVFRELESRLVHEYDLPPSEETRALAESIRSGDDGRVGAEPASVPAAVTGPGNGPVAAPAVAIAADTSAWAAPSSRPGSTPAGAPASRMAPVGLAAAVVLVLIAGALLIRPGATDFAPPDVVAVLPFEYRGAAEHAYLAEGLADLLAANLDGAGELRTVDPRALLAGRQPMEHPIPPHTARREAAAHGAGSFVLGSVTEAGGRLRVAAALYGGNGRSGAGPAEVVVEGSADDVLGLVDRLAIGLLGGRSPTNLIEVSVRTTHSLEALKAFLSGEAALRRSAVHEAIDHYRRASELDSTFALAHYRLSSAAYRQGIARIPARGAAAALRHAGRLAREDSLLVAAWHHHVNGYAAEAHRFYEEALVLRPSHVEAAYQLGELLFHWGSAIGIPAAEAREPFSRVLAVEPDNVQAALHLARLAARDGRPQQIDSLVAAMSRADPRGAWEVEMDALRAFLSTDAAWQDRAIVVAARQPSRDRAILEHMAAFSYNMAAVERLALARLAAERPPAEQARLELFLAHIRLARGRYRDAVRGIESAAALPASRRLDYRAMMAALPFLPLSADELDGVRSEVAAEPDLDLGAEGGPFADRGVEYPHVLWPGMYRPQRLRLLGALHVRLGDATAAEAVADSLARIGPGEPLAFHYERLLRGRIAAAAGRPAAALRALGPVEPPPHRTFETLVDHDRPYERWLRAELLRESGRLAEALRWYGTFPDPIGRDLPYIAPSHLRRAEIHDASGDHAQAAFHYGRFIQLWADADPELQPQVARARERLRSISGR